MNSTQSHQGKIYFKKHIQQLMNLNIQTIRRMWVRGEFPKPILINGRCAWRAEVVNQWINALEAKHG
jgi:predicted DNA-binding transcriptional regulator AlpA